MNENNGNGNAFVVFFVSFHLVWRCFFQQRFVQKCNVGVSLQFSSIFNVLFEQKSFTVYFVCWLCSCSCDFVSFVKIFNMQLQGVLGIFQQRFAQKCNVGVCAVFINFQCFVCAVIFHRVIFVCSLCSCSCDFVFHGSSCVFVCKLSGRLSEKVPRQGSLLVSTVCLA